MKRHPQHPEEFNKLCEWARDAESILEIGSRYGTSLVGLARAMKGKKVVAVDLPDAEGWKDPGIVLELEQNVKMLQDEGFDVHLIIGDSHHPDTLSKVTELGPYDLVFIDGDHSYKGVKQDYEYYGPLGKQVVFHDIVKPLPGRNVGLEVWQFWQELKGEEFIAHKSPMGIGRVWNAN